MDSLNLSLSDSEDEDEVLHENLLRIANGTDDSDLDSSNTPTEALDETEQGQGSANPNDEPIIISDESDTEEDSAVIATVSLNHIIFSAFLGMAMRVNLKKLTKREIDIHCKNYEEAEASNDRKEDCIDNRSSISNMWSIPSTPRKAPKRTESRSRLSSSKKKMSVVKKRTGGRERSMFDIGSPSAPAAALRNDSKEVEEEDPIFFGSPKKRTDPVVKTPTATPNKMKVKQPTVVIRHTKQRAATLRDLSQEYLREEVEELTTRRETMGMEKDHDSGTDLSPPFSKSQSDIFSSQLEASQPGPALMLGRLVNENISSDEEEPYPSLVMDVSRDLFSQSQSQEDVNANNPQQEEEEEEYHCLLCDETFKEETDHEQHVKVCMSRRPAPSLPPSSSKVKRPRSPSPSPPSRAPGASAAPMMTSAAPLMASAAPLAPRSPPCASNLLAPSVKPKLAKIPKLKGTSEELKAGRLLPSAAKENEVKRILDKIGRFDNWVQNCWEKAATSKKAAPALEDELERNDILNANVEVAEEIRKLGCDSDTQLLEYFRKKHKNKEKSDPNKNLTCISWRPPGLLEDAVSSQKGRDDMRMNDSEKVSFEDWKRELTFKIARNVVDKKGLEADEKGIKELALYFAHVKKAQDETESFWAAYLTSREVPRSVVDVALEIEAHVSSYESIYEGSDNFSCHLCGSKADPKPHRFNF